MELVKLFEYQGNNVTFKNESGVTFVNATEMAKSFGKRPIDYLQNQNTSDFLNELSKVRNSTLADLVKVVKGGNAPGTWMHEDVAIEFSRWLSPTFAIWCNDRMKELLTTGQTKLPTSKELAQMVIDAENRNEALRLVINTNAPKVIFSDAVSVSHTTVLIGELAKIIKQNGVDIGQNRLFAWLRENQYLISRAGTDFNMPTQKSMNLELFVIKETVLSHSDGHTSITKTPKVTGKGQIYFVNKFVGGDAMPLTA